MKFVSLLTKFDGGAELSVPPSVASRPRQAVVNAAIADLSRAREKAAAISVVIPALNEIALLPRMLRQFTPALRSLYSLEIIVSDGGSTDGTIEVAEREADIVIEHTATGRQTIAQGRNRGAAAASGDILIFLNADTLFASPETFFKGVSRTFASGATDAAAFPIFIFPEEKTPFDSIFHAFYNRYIRLLNVAGIGMGRGECQAIRRSVFEQAGGYNEALTAGEDFDLYRRVRKDRKIAYLQRCVVFESPRRYRKFGYSFVVWNWFKNAISVMFANKSVADSWEQVR